MALHGNAGMAALKLKCYVQCIEHCNALLELGEFMYNDTRSQLVSLLLQYTVKYDTCNGVHCRRAGNDDYTNDAGTGRL